jgi:hypothetical protein
VTKINLGVSVDSSVKRVLQSLEKLQNSDPRLHNIRMKVDKGDPQVTSKLRVYDGLLLRHVTLPKLEIMLAYGFGS